MTERRDVALSHPIPLPVLEAAVHGAVELEQVGGGFAPRRLPCASRPFHAYDDLWRLASHTSGVTLRVSTAASRLELELLFQREAPVATRLPAHRAVMVAETATTAQLVSVGEGDLLIEYPDRSAERVPGGPSLVRFELGESAERAVTIWLPHAAGVTILGGSADAPVTALALDLPRWVHYGSSISHGSDLDDPRRPWPVQAARQLDLQLTNLGLAGNAMLDPFVARTIAALPAELITLKIGINLVNGDAMRSRTFVPAVHGFLDLVREGHPTTPIVIISALGCAIHEQTPGPVREVAPGQAGGTPRESRPFDGTLTLERTREHLAQAVQVRADAQLRLISGLDLLGLDEQHLLPDNLHPNDEGHALIARRFTGRVAAVAPQRVVDSRTTSSG
jgi:hypothetical protein